MGGAAWGHALLPGEDVIDKEGLIKHLRDLDSRGMIRGGEWFDEDNPICPLAHALVYVRWNGKDGYAGSVARLLGISIVSVNEIMDQADMVSTKSAIDLLERRLG